MTELVFLKLGGSAITDKTRGASAREDVIRRIAREIVAARATNPRLRLLLGHGSGSYGHYTATKTGYGKKGNWQGFAETGAAAARLNRLMVDLLLEEGIPVVAMQPSASAVCQDGELVELATAPVKTALESGLVPLVYGDVAFDITREMSIISTEMIFAYLARTIKPSRIILAGIVQGVYSADPQQNLQAEFYREISPANIQEIESQLHGSHGYDVTGGMLTKVKTMLDLVKREPGLYVRLISALEPGGIERALLDPTLQRGTLIHADS